jgi:hypothetical protein
MEKNCRYSLFTQSNEELLSKLTLTYIEFYKTKEIFLKGRDEIITLLNEQNENNFIKKDINENIIENEINKSVKGDTIAINNEKCVKEKSSEETKSRLYNTLILKTHPDKSESKSSALYQDIQASKYKFAKLCVISRILNIPIPSLENEEIDEIKRAIEKKEKKIKFLEKTYPYLIYTTETKEKKKIYLDELKKRLDE